MLVEDDDGTRTKLSATDWTQRESVAKRLLTPGDTSDEIKGKKIVCVISFILFDSYIWSLLVDIMYFLPNTSSLTNSLSMQYVCSVEQS